ncbi:MAG TPA: hypothetical protein VKC54_00455 [Patescibacteria group bacterium]|nr:hypothetical protein [Patescibacteria group bacterium]
MKERKPKEAEELGGSEEDLRLEYEQPDTVPYFDKPDHFKRSLANQPNHGKVAKKIGLPKKTGEIPL